ncbi:hypothetical protein MMC10_008133 [Thelotrema lepadinum]|nr:hypothetical protein [Thelotrema lepadinum]
MAEAARLGNFAAVRTLRDHDVMMNGSVKIGEDDCSVLLLAATRMRTDHELKLSEGSQYASIEMLEFLVHCGADENLDWLFRNGLDLSGQSICNIMMRVLHEHGSLDILQFLTQSEIPIFSPDEPLNDHRSFTTNTHPLSFFILLSPTDEFIHQVLETNIDVNGIGRLCHTETPIQAATRRGNLRRLKELVSRGVLLNDSKHGYTPLQIACGAEMDYADNSTPAQLDIAMYLLENGADPNEIARNENDSYQKERYNSPALEIAMLSPAPSIRLIQLLLDFGANVNADTGTDSFILNAALTQTHFSGPEKRRVVEMLIDKGADINPRRRADRTLGPSALEAVCENGGHDCIGFVQLLLDRGAKLHPSSGSDYRCALQIACYKNNFDVVKLLLDRGMDPNNSGVGYAACSTQDIDLLKLLLDRGMNPNTDSMSGGPLTKAASNGDLPMALLLLASGAKVPVGTSSQNCLLIAAVENKRLDMVALLLQFETREEILARAISTAQWKCHVAIVSYIEKHKEGIASRALHGQVEELGADQLDGQSFGLPSAVTFGDTGVGVTMKARAEDEIEGMDLRGPQLDSPSAPSPIW